MDTHLDRRRRACRHRWRHHAQASGVPSQDGLGPRATLCTDDALAGAFGQQCAQRVAGPHRQQQRDGGHEHNPARPRAQRHQGSHHGGHRRQGQATVARRRCLLGPGDSAHSLAAGLCLLASAQPGNAGARAQTAGNAFHDLLRPRVPASVAVRVLKSIRHALPWGSLPPWAFGRS